MQQAKFVRTFTEYLSGFEAEPTLKAKRIKCSQKDYEVLLPTEIIIEILRYNAGYSLKYRRINRYFKSFIDNRLSVSISDTYIISESFEIYLQYFSKDSVEQQIEVLLLSKFLNEQLKIWQYFLRKLTETSSMQYTKQCARLIKYIFSKYKMVYSAEIFFRKIFGKDYTKIKENSYISSEIFYYAMRYDIMINLLDEAVCQLC